MKRTIVLAVALPVLAGACGGGGSGGGAASAVPIPGFTPGASATATPTPAAGGTTVIGIPAPSPSPSPPASTTVTGTVMQIPVDAYGPITMNGVTYASSDSTQTTALANAVVMIGPVPVTGPTAPAVVPSGDVIATTTATGSFSATLAVAPAPPSTVEPFVFPQNNILGFAAPASGYYVEVYAANSDAKSVGNVISLHRFVPATPAIALHVSTIAAVEANALALANADRASFSAEALTLDESAEEIARLHAADEGVANYTCHYDRHNVGPSSRYLAAAGIGLTGENLALSYGPDAASAAHSAEGAFTAEGSTVPQGGHYLNLVDPTHVWAGIAVAAYSSAPGFFEIDQEFVSPSAQSAVVGAYGYPISSGCANGTTVNNS